MIPVRTAKYSALILQGLRRGWHVAKICAMGKAGLINTGDEPDPLFPQRATVFDWVGTDAQFAELYMKARVAGTEAMVDENFLISDDRHADSEYIISEKTGELVKITDHEHINRSRLRVDTRKWYVSKIVPKIYGDRVEIEHKGNVDITARLTAGRQRVGADVPAQLDDRSAERGLLIEGSAVRVADDGSELV